MSTKIFTDRSRIETAQRCARLRFLEYHEGPEHLGITSIRKPLPLAVGGSVHEGLAVLLREGQQQWAADGHLSAPHTLEDNAVKVALADFAQFQAQLDIDSAEQYAMDPSVDDPELKAKMAALIAKGRSDFDIYLYAEQSALVEAIVRAYARRRLIPLLEQYEVLEVEREGQWLLSEFGSNIMFCMVCNLPWVHGSIENCCCGNNSFRQDDTRRELWFMSRPDALLLERQSHELYILSFKTAAKWDRRKAEDAKRDMQGLSEGVEVEKRLGEWWKLIHNAPASWSLNAGFVLDTDEVVSATTADYLRHLESPPRIMGIRYEYLLKGDRWTDKELTAKLAIEARSQRSPLIRAYKNDGMAAGDEQWNVSWDYHKEDGSTSKLYYKNWQSAPVWESMPIKQWIDWLDQTAEVVGEEGSSKGWGGPAQSTGFLPAHPLDELFIPPIIIYRNDDDLRDWIESTEAQERRVAESVARINAAGDEGERRHLLNVLMPMTRRACSYPTDCSMILICYGGSDIKHDPLSSGRYKTRTVNHPIEMEAHQ